MVHSFKSAVFGSSSSLPPFIDAGGGLVCKSVGTADLLSDHFGGKQFRESVDLPFTCHPSPCLTTFSFRSSEIRRLLWDLKQFEINLFPQDMIQDIYKLHWNTIHKSTGVTWNVGLYKLIRLPGHPNLNLNLT